MTLVVVSTPIGNLGDLSPRAADALRQADLIACEDTRHTRKLLTATGISGVPLVSVHGHNERERIPQLLDKLRNGTRIALVSDAGTPAVSDPGQLLVAAAIEAGVDVEVVPGPSAVLAALVVSGLATDRFVFEGFLPRKGRERRDRLEAAGDDVRTTVFFESPHRLAETMAELAEVCGPDRRVAMARELTKRFEEVWRGTLAEAADHAATVDARGEYVVVLEGASGSRHVASEADVDEAVASLMAAGASAKDAAAQVAADLRIPRRRAYEAALRLRSAGAGRGPSDP